MRNLINRAWIVALALPVLLTSNSAAAQNSKVEIDIEVPVVVLEDRKATDFEESELDLANIVQTAAKGVTTVQEAPAIVTVLTAEEINDRGFTTVMGIADSVPGWMRADGFYGQFPTINTRNTGQAVLYLVNSVQMFDPFYNIPSIWRIQPIETIKRIEMITGPGGVLWGANSYLGILNIITKDADDVDGVEAGVRVGDGPGDRGLFRGYVMAGVPDLPFDSSVFLHASVESYQGPKMIGTQNFFASSSPNPSSLRYRGAQIASEQDRSVLFNLTGKINIAEKLNLYVGVPFSERNTAMSFTGYAAQADRLADTLDACDPDTIVDPTMVPGQCSDPSRLARNNSLDWFDRYAIAEYRTRIADGKAGVTAKGYLTQFVRDFPGLLINYPQGSAIGAEALAGPNALSPGGTGLAFNGTNYRAGFNLDGDLELPSNVRLLYGAEAFHEWYPEEASGASSLQGDGILTSFATPAPTSLPLPCPADPTDDYSPLDPTNSANLVYREGCPLTHVFDANRTVMGAYVNPQWKPMRKVTLDGGIRVQGAPDSMSTVGYDTRPIFSGALVYNFAKNWFFKLNYAQGFRPPVFNSLFSNGEAVQFDGTDDLKTEESQALQAEVNARLFRGVRRIREFNFRADYSYTVLDNQISVVEGRYQNLDRRGIHSTEFLGKLYLEGGHRIELAYTWARTHTEDRGLIRAVPNHWFNISGVFSVIGDVLQASTRMRVVGSYEDPNQLTEYRDFRVDEFSDPSMPSYGRTINDRNGQVGCTLLTPDGCLIVAPHELVRDRIPASAELTLGLAYRPMRQLSLSAWVYNSFNARSYQPDTFNDLPGQNPIPFMREDIRAVFNAVYNY